MNNLRFFMVIFLLFSYLFSHSQGNKKQGILAYDLIISAPPIFSQLSAASQANIPKETHHKVNVYFKENWRRYEDSTLVKRSNGNYHARYKNAEAGWLMNNSDNRFYLMHQINNKIYYSEDMLNSHRWRFTLSIYDADTTSSTKFERVIPKINDLKGLIITDKYKEIMGYTCRQAFYKTDIVQLDGIPNNDSIEIWFTEDLPANISPMPCSIINGAVLEVKAHRYHYTATGIKFLTFDDTHVALPKEGIKLTIADEEKLIAKAMK